MKEVISIHIGQGGVQLGNSCWKQFFMQHEISNDGVKSNHYQLEDNDSFKKIFHETKEGKHIPRSLFIDLQPDAIDKMMSEGRLYMLQDQYVSGKEDASSNYARGHFNLGKKIIDQSMDKIRKLIDNCSTLQGFMIYSSLGGGTGSGFGSLLIQNIKSKYEKTLNLDFNIYPSPQLSTAFVEPYNAILSTSAMMKHQDLSVVFQNEAVFQISQKTLDVQSPNYRNINSILAQVITSVTTSMRFGGDNNFCLQDFYKNLSVGYPPIHFLLATYAPLRSVNKAYHEDMTTSDMTQFIFEPFSMMAKCDPRKRKYLTCCLSYRGDVSPRDVNESIANLRKRKTVKFVDWCYGTFKPCINRQPPMVSYEGNISKSCRSLSMISNTTAIDEVLSRLKAKFDKMFHHKAFVHWYTSQGMQISQFQQAQQTMVELQKDYELLEQDTEVD